MHPFENDLLVSLRGATNGEDVLEFANLRRFGLDVGWGGGNLIQCHYKASVSIAGDTRHWEGQPSETMIWKLIGCRILGFELASEFCLRIEFERGGEIFVYSEDGPHESAFVILPGSDAPHGMRIY